MNFSWIHLTLLLLTSSVGFGQKCDTSEVLAICKEARAELAKDLNKSYHLALLAYSRSGLCLNSNARYQAILSLSDAYYHKDNNDSTISLLVPLMESLPPNIPKKYIAAFNHKLSLAFVNTMKLEKGLKYGLEALKYYELCKDTANTVNILVNIANVYDRKNNFKQADKYLREAEHKAKLISQKVVLGNVYNTMGILYAQNGQLDSAEKFLLLSTSIREILKDKTTLAWNYNNLGGLNIMMKKFPEAIGFLEKAFSVFKENGNMEGQSDVANNLGELYLDIKEFKKAIYYLNISRNLYSFSNNPDNLESLYKNFYTYYQKNGDLKKAIRYSDSLLVLKDSLQGSRLDASMTEMQTKYETEKKEAENRELKDLNKIKEFEIAKQKQKVFISNLIIVCGLIFFFLLSCLVYVLLRKRRIQQKAETEAELNRQKELRVRSIIEAEEKERRRIAQDLHDGIGQILSAAKLNLSSLESTIITTSQAQKDALKNTLDLIDDSVKEVRTVSHNMMPNVLIKLGLASAVREFITKLGNLPNLKIDLEIVGLNKRLEENVETALYRAIQEIVNNIIKHAKADKIGIQLIRHDKELSVVIEDNGVGFDVEKINAFGGIGLKNILSRVEFINGTVHFDSLPGRGTIVLIDVPVS